MRLRLLLNAALLLCLPAFAQTSARSLEDRVAQLSQQINQQQQQIESLQKLQAELLKELQTAKGTQASVSAPEVADSREAAIPVTRASAHADRTESDLSLGEKVKIGGYGSIRFETNDVASGNNVPGGSAGGFTFRRFVVTTDAKPAKRLRIYSELEYERLHEIEVEKGAGFSGGTLGLKQTIEGNSSGELALEQAWGQFNFAENHGLRAGVVLSPVGRFNLLHDDDYWDIPRRTLTDRDAPVLPIKSAWRDLGAGLVGSFNVGAKGKLDYQLFALNGAALDFNMEHESEISSGAPGEANAVLNAEMQLSSGFFDGTKSASAVAWRAAYSPTLNGEIALSGYHGKYAPSFLSFREPLTSVAFDHKWRWKGFETEGEFVHTSLGNLDNVLNAFATATFNSVNEQLASSSGGGLTKLEVETELANLSRSRYGFWNDFKYHARPKWLRNSVLGRSFEDPQLIPIVRYERVWLNGVTDDVEVTAGAVTGSTRENLSQDRFTAGVSYRPNLQFAIQAAFEHNRKLDGSRLIFPKVNQNSTNGLILGMSFAF